MLQKRKTPNKQKTEHPINTCMYIFPVSSAIPLCDLSAAVGLDEFLLETAKTRTAGLWKGADGLPLGRALLGD